MYSWVQASDGARRPFFCAFMSLQKLWEDTGWALIAPTGSFDDFSCFVLIFFSSLFLALLGEV